MQRQHPRVLFIIYFDLGIGGVQRKIVDIVNRLQELPAYNNTKIHILLTVSDNNILASRIHNPNVKIHYKPLFRLPLWTYIFAYALVYRPESLLAFLPQPALHASIAKRLLFWRNIRLAISEDVITSHAFHRNDFTDRTNHILPWVFSRADVVLTPSKSIADDLVRRYHVPKILLVQTQNWTVMPGPSQNAAKTVDCVYIGRFSKEKRIPLLLSAFAQIRKTDPGISLRLVGEGEESGRIIREIRRLHLTRNVIISKPRPDVYAVLYSAKLAVFASGSEGVPIYLLEAMSAGLPVIVMSFPGAKDIIVQNKSGIICYNTSQMVSAIKKLLSKNTLRSSMGTYAQKMIHKYYSSANIDTFIRYLFSSDI